MQHVVRYIGAVYFTELYFNTVVLYSYCALGCRCKATDICAREPLLDAVETSALMVPAAAVRSSVCRCHRALTVVVLSDGGGWHGGLRATAVDWRL